MAMNTPRTTAVESAVIDVHGIGKAYPHGRGERVPVLREIDLRITPGSIVGLLGPNGAGKTTLVKILAGLLRPDLGGGTVLGYDLLRRHAQIRARVSLVAPTADVGTDNNLTVRQNLEFWAPIYGLRGAHARERIAELLHTLGLEEKADFWPMHISAGQRQRLALARSLLAENRLLFLDEPTNKLDLEGVRSVRDMIADLNREQGTTILLTTHVMEEAEELCGEIALLCEGRLVAHQPTAQLTQSLRLARPITLTARRADAHSDDAETDWLAQLEALPGVTQVTLSSSHSVQVDQADAPGVSAHLLTCVVHSLDPRATTPALLVWARTRDLALVSIAAEPVTLTDVFNTLSRATVADGAAARGTS
ncbi:MAG TPA: ABC transporter ATP-binding protein [Ktedonobacterales bacterium]